MKHRKPAKGPRGKPFQKGLDPRRNMGGNLNAEAQSYEIRLRNALAVKLDPEIFADIVIEEVKKHRPGAREFYAKWLMGEGKDKVEHSGELNIQFIMPRPKDKK